MLLVMVIWFTVRWWVAIRVACAFGILLIGWLDSFFI